MGFESMPQIQQKPKEKPKEAKVENNEERERLTKELENENKSIEYCEKTVQEAEKKYEEYSKLANDNRRSDSSKFMENSRLAQVYLDRKKDYQQRSEESKARRLDLERKLGELSMVK